MDKTEHYSHTSGRMPLWLIIVPVAVDLLQNNTITWSKWAILGFIIMFFMDYMKNPAVDTRAMTILRERYAKGELTEEEYLNAKAESEKDISRSRDSQSHKIVGAILILIGAVYVLSNFLYIPMDIPWLAIILIGLGISVIIRNTR